MTSRSCLILVFFLGLPAALCAQKQQGSWSDLRGLRVGQGIVVIESSMKRHDGEFVSVTTRRSPFKKKVPRSRLNAKTLSASRPLPAPGAASMP